jgi:hypothetical protein
MLRRWPRCRAPAACYPTSESFIGWGAEMRAFYGWWIVAACMLAALFGNALGLFGAGVYLHEVVKANGWTIGLVSGAVTLFYVVSALLLIPVGSGIRHFGPGLIVALAGIALASGVVEVGQATVLWQVYLAFLLMGIGWAGLSTTAVATTLAPWFDRHQGRATSIASLGASVGGIMGAPTLLFGIAQIGFVSTTLVAGVSAVIVLLPLAGLVLRHRPPGYGASTGRLAIGLRRYTDRYTELDPPDGLAHLGAPYRHGNFRHRHDGTDRFPHPPGHSVDSLGWLYGTPRSRSRRPRLPRCWPALRSLASPIKSMRG